MIPLAPISFLLALPTLGLAAGRPKNAILLSEVESLTLRGNGAMTNHRRVPAIPQLRCLSNPKICDLYDIDVMRCVNQGSSYGTEDIQWSCTASLPEELKLGSTDVICEGYSSPNDDYVLKGSCGVEYRLALTNKGKQKYPSLAGDGSWFNDGHGNTDWNAVLFVVIFLIILGCIIWSFIKGQNRREPWRPGTRPSKPDDVWTPGFWTGVAGGAAAGFWAGNRNRDDRHDHGRYGSVGRNHGWSNGSSRSSSSSSNNQHESTGFGSTSRR
ncbi:hypothetical protein BGZ63DRAFT_112280 [Mariannaea sp. PMI_226]|nr:hypothetical protein BGZ63DRAFT_112280 [Mariannaea sp. PMI_226]